MDVDYSKPEVQDVIAKMCQEARKTRHNVISPANEVNLVVRLSNKLVVKFGVGVRAAEAYALAYAAEHLDPTVIKVPSVRQYFTRPCHEIWMTGDLVMDMVEGHPLSTMEPHEFLHLADKITHALRHIYRLSRNRPGPLDGSTSQGPLWSEDGAGQSFESRNDLQEYLDMRLNYRKVKTIPDITIAPLVLCHMDIAPRNIVLGTDGCLYLPDRGCAGFYPAAFENWAIPFEAHQFGHPVMKRVAAALAASSSDGRLQADALVEVYAVNQCVAL